MSSFTMTITIEVHYAVLKHVLQGYEGSVAIVTVCYNITETWC